MGLTRRGSARHVAAWFAAALACGAASARDLWESDDGDRSIALTTTIKGTTVMPESGAATNLWRLRFGFAADTPSSHAEIDYENRTRSSPAGAGLVTGLPLEAPAPFRLRP